MISYKDRWWCATSETCANAEGCDRVITPEVVEAGTRWWGDPDFPIAMLAPECHVPKEDQDEDSRKQATA